MRVGIGSAVIVLIVVLIGSGYLLYGYSDTTKELNNISEKAAQLEQENQVLREQVDSANAEIENLNAQVNDLKQQILSWQEQTQQLKEQNQTLQGQNATLVQQKKTLEERIAVLDGKILTIQSTNSMDTETPKKITYPLDFPLLVPFLPIAVVATYVVARQRTKNSIQTNQGTRLNNTERGNMVKLSDDEMKAVIKMRRGHTVG